MIVLLERGGATAGQRAALSDTEAHHLRVRRARAGEPVELRDGFGLVGAGRLVQRGGAWEVDIERVDRGVPPSPLVLAVGAGDRERFVWMLEKAAELGATAVVPILTERTAGVASRLRPAQMDRLRRGALEAVKQSGNPWSCALEEPTALADLLARPPEAEQWLADRDGVPPPGVQGPIGCRVLVGPEGGFTDGERSAALGAGYRPVSLGPHILRFETAAVAAAAAVQAARLRNRNV